MESTDVHGTLLSVLNFVREALSVRSARFLDRAERTLVDAAAGIQDLTERGRMIPAARWLSEHKGRIESALHRSAVDALGAAPPASGIAESSNLRVLEANELALSLARDRMVSVVMTEGRAELAALEVRFEILRRGGAYANPKALWPGAIADRFLAVLRDLGAPETVQRLLVDTYGVEGIRLLLEFYRQINSVLIEGGVAPAYQLPAQPPPMSLDSHQSPAANDVNIFNLARHLKQVLDELEKTMSGVSVRHWRPGFLRGLIERHFAGPGGLGERRARSIMSAAQAQSVDHIEGLLLDWLRDDKISARVREQIQRLTLPLLVARLSMTDDFAAPDNPVRVFLRQLAVLGYRDEESPLSTFDSLRLIVDRIVAEQGGEAGSFRGAAEALNTLSRHEVRRKLATQAQERIARPAADPVREEARDVAREAHRQVTTELAEHAAGLGLPPEIKLFVLRLMGPWMMLRYQRYGADSFAWKEARIYASRFFDGLRPGVSEADELRKRALRERILFHAQRITGRSKVPPADLAPLLEALERYLASLNSPNAQAAAQAAPPASGDDFLEGLEPVSAR